MSRRQGGCRNSASNSPELRNGFAGCLYRAFVTWKLVLGSQAGGRARDVVEVTYTTIRGYPHATVCGGRKAALGTQKAEIARSRARGSAAPSCPPHPPVPCALASSRRWFSLPAFCPPVSGFSLSAFCLLPRCRDRVRLRREACCRAFRSRIPPAASRATCDGSAAGGMWFRSGAERNEVKP